ncbi:MAG: carbohydrate ABC transporter permease [Niameybacter sp.]|uniref:carbohydrate ABC transporter permease n=1 Tax=Niameybacter sp. TaxID=2033640 RepID=UPI002FCC4DD5
MTISAHKKAKILKNTRSFLIKFGRAILLFGICFVILYPLITKFMISFMSIEDVYDNSVRYIPRNFTLNNYVNAFKILEIKDIVWMSFLVPGILSVIHMCASTVVAYGFARYNFRFKNFFFVLVILGMVIPPDLVLLPLYMRFRYFDIFGILEMLMGSSLNLLNTPWPQVLLGATCTGLKNGLYIFIMVQYFRGLPKELEEAAYVDGAGTFQAFMKVFLPSARQIMMTVFLFSFVWQWLDDIYTSAFMKNTKIMSTQLLRLSNTDLGNAMGIQNTAEFSLMRNASMVIALLPILILYLICQKYFTESVERSGLTG